MPDEAGGPVRTSNYWSALQEETKESSVDGWQSNDVASGDARLVSNSSAEASDGSRHASGVLNAAGVGLDSFLGTACGYLRVLMLPRVVTNIPKVIVLTDRVLLRPRRSHLHLLP